MNDTKKIVSLGLIFCIFCVILSGWFGRSMGENIAFLLEYRKSAPKIVALNASLSKIPLGVDTTELKKEAEAAKYDSTKLSADISNEMSLYGMVVMDVAVKQTSEKEVSLSIKGIVPASKIYNFMLGISSTDKFFFVKKLNLYPRNSAVQMISRLDQLQRNSRAFQELKSSIEKSGLDSFNVDIEALVVTS